MLNWENPQMRVKPQQCVYCMFWIFSEYLLNGSEVKVAQSFLTLTNPMDYTVHGILARILE